MASDKTVNQGLTKLILLLGFFGAGKTTLMQKILNEYTNEKIGVIINELGEINIDGMLLQRNGVQMQELSNGSIFCACIKANFLESLIEMSKLNLRFLFVEASGLADPSSIPEILHTIAPHTSDIYEYNGSVCIVDSQNFFNDLDIFPAVGNQINYANAVIINKADLVHEQDLNKINEKITELHPDVKIYRTSYCAVDILSVIDELRFDKDITRMSSNTFESRPKTFIIEGDGVFSQENIITLVNNLSAHTLRIKGFAATENGNIEVHSVGKTVDVKPWNEKLSKTQLVVISAVGIKIIGIITEGIKTIPGLKMRI